MPKKRTGPKPAKRGAPTKDLPGLYRWPLDPAAWDFRNIPPEEVKVAVYDEYACSCDWIRSLWEKWMQTPFPSWEEVQLTDDMVKLVWDFQKTRPVHLILSQHFQKGIPRCSTAGYTDLAAQLVATMPGLLRGYEFEDILFAVPAFPTPWLALDAASKDRLKERFVIPYWQDRAFSVFDPSEPIAAYRQNSSYQNRIFEVAVDWNRGEKEIVADFTKWLAPKYKQFGRPTQGPPGPGQFR